MQANKNVMEATAGFRLSCVSVAFGPPLLITSVKLKYHTPCGLILHLKSNAS